jgi:tetratricopeptide (TPR) repeat protein
MLSICYDKDAIETGDFEKSLYHLNKAKEFGSKKSNYINNLKTHYSRRGSYYLDKMDYKKALEYYLKALEGGTDNNHIFMCGAGHALIKLEKFDEGRHYYKNSIKLNKLYAPAFHFLGLSYFINREFKEANGYFKDACEIDSNQPQYIMDYAKNLWHLKQYDKAIEFFYKIRMLQPNAPTPYLVLSTALLQVERYEELFKLLNSVPEIVEANSKLQEVIEECKIKLGHVIDKKLPHLNRKNLSNKNIKDD